MTKQGKLDTEKTETRETWGHRVDGIVTLLGYSVGEGTLLKFPYLCARNGGGAFLIPYLVFVGLCAVPLYFLEVVIGQYYQRGPVEVWKFCPAMKGLGLGTVLVSWVYAMYTSMYFSWYLYYFFNSFFNPLPWSTCGNPWNTPSCVESTLHGRGGMNTTVNGTVPLQGAINTTQWGHLNGSTANVASASEEFWRHNALDISSGLDDTGSIRWPLFGCLLFTYVTMYIMLFKGIRVTGKIVYVTFMCPVLVCAVFLIRGSLLPGATDGILYLMRPDFGQLKSPKIWIEACGYALHSMGTSTGIANTISSHNQRSSNCYRVALILCIVDPLITIFCGLSIFTVLGHMAYVTGVNMDDFQSSGLNLAFSVLPEAVSYLPVSQLWSVLVFLMMMTLGLDTTVPSLEITQETLADQFPSLAKRRWLLLMIVFLPCFLLALPYTTQGGIYALTLVDWYSSVPPVMLFGVVECLVLAWVFGVRRLDKCTLEMYGQTIPKWLTFLMKYITPGLLMTIFLYAFYEYRPPKYGDYFYPEWATVIGWLISLFMIVPTPCWMVYCVWKSEGDTFKQKLVNAFIPEDVPTDTPIDDTRGEQEALNAIDTSMSTHPL